MGLRVKLDEDLSPLVAEPLAEAGHSTSSVVEQGWSGLSDDELWEKVCEEQLFFITADKGFGDIRVFVPGTHPGILLLRPARESLLEYQELVAEVVARHELERLAGAVTVARPGRVRVRRRSV